MSMDDTTFGRKWCENYGVTTRQPNSLTRDYIVEGLPALVRNELRDDRFTSEDAAYASIGRAVRKIMKVLAAIPIGYDGIAGEIKEVL